VWGRKVCVSLNHYLDNPTTTGYQAHCAGIFWKDPDAFERSSHIQ
jgi:hypothetical protein